MGTRITASVTETMKALKSYRQRNGLSQSEAAEKLSVSVRTLQNWERGANEPRGFAKNALMQMIEPKSARANAKLPRKRKVKG